MRKKERVVMRPKTLYTHTHTHTHTHTYIYIYVMSFVTSWMITLLCTHKILNKRRMKELVYLTLTSVIYTGPGLLGILGRSLCAYNVFDINIGIQDILETGSSSSSY